MKCILMVCAVIYGTPVLALDDDFCRFIEAKAYGSMAGYQWGSPTNRYIGGSSSEEEKIAEGRVQDAVTFFPRFASDEAIIAMLQRYKQAAGRDCRADMITKEWVPFFDFSDLN